MAARLVVAFALAIVVVLALRLARAPIALIRYEKLSARCSDGASQRWRGMLDDDGCLAPSFQSRALRRTGQAHQELSMPEIFQAWHS